MPRSDSAAAPKIETRQFRTHTIDDGRQLSDILASILMEPEVVGVNVIVVHD